MKKIIFVLSLAVLALSCKQEPKNYVSISGKITNPTDSIITFLKGREFNHTVTIQEDGTFKDTINLEEGVYFFKYGEEFGQMFLKNDNTSSFSLDTEQFDETLKFEGDAADKNNFMVSATLNLEKNLDEDIFDQTEDQFNAAISNLKSDFQALKTNYPTLDSTFVSEQNNMLDQTIGQYTNYFNSKLEMRRQFPVGSPSPVFNNYENYAGGTTSLSDLKGKYVYIDVWATWCGPCKREIPSLKTLEKDYEDKDITFVSISVDNGRGYNAKEGEDPVAISKEGWKKMIADKEMGGIQLFADNAWESEFIQAYKINSIPRFLLIDKAGNIVNADAPRPSSTSIRKLFDALEI
jgi:thiol-disulfide isomerase/thioredoxin